MSALAVAEPAAERRIGPGAVAQSLETEARLMRDLARILDRQRDGVARDDVAAVDDAVFAAHRVLLTLNEARRRRDILVHALVGTADVPLDGYEDALGDAPALVGARDGLLDAARALARAASLNRSVLGAVLREGEERVRMLRGAAPPDGYGAAPAARSLMDRRA